MQTPRRKLTVVQQKWIRKLARKAAARGWSDDRVAAYREYLRDGLKAGLSLIDAHESAKDTSRYEH